MSKNISSIENLINLFDEFIDEDDILSSKILAKISSEIVNFRVQKNLNQKEFAEFLNVSQSMVSKMESSDYNFSIKTLVKICNKMGVIPKIELSSSQKKPIDNYYIINVQDNDDYTGIKTYSLFQPPFTQESYNDNTWKQLK